MWELDHKKAEHQRIDAFELWCWRRLLRVPWTVRSNPSILKEISPEYSLVANILAAWWKELIHWKRPWCWERLKAGREGNDRGWDGWMASPTWWTWVGDRQWGLCCSPWGCRAGQNWATELNTIQWVFIVSLSPVYLSNLSIIIREDSIQSKSVLHIYDWFTK